ncbi:iron-sulfur cluster repair di-iron protein [Flagellimonas zhangzhouensis]|uniref:Regulator of cell morphogenesis and NO signaling n=1 Tax=Flagellimonas zhangzhouensis TaxID=1073328 RepID=A0A1H2QML9_9FLAO|nr:iron-sulfur cluster repair di-iron protein [Allomuricauda zhangzhouensis]SDQ54915.1 regulator of cell morphogenesis and NO signaling [Allomuricauda zhangzhouensis]SDW08325.1 regulator of cell morphogenesis and NO signaling [Allomuricauda zhangzhouensis]
MNHIIEKTIGQMVAQDYRTAQVFKNHKIDFCCKGNRTLQEVADKKGLDLETLTQELDSVQNQDQGDQPNFKTWPLDLLIDYIEKKHHRYVEQQIPILKQYLNKLCRVHGERHPELLDILEHFNASAGELSMHMKKEELVLFPWIRKMSSGTLNNSKVEPPHFGTVKNPIRMMMDEHDNEGERFRKIAQLSNDYKPPSDACNTYRVTFSLLQEFEDDLHRHIHLENNILFPKSEILENKVLTN